LDIAQLQYLRAIFIPLHSSSDYSDTTTLNRSMGSPGSLRSLTQGVSWEVAFGEGRGRPVAEVPLSPDKRQMRLRIRRFGVRIPTGAHFPVAETAVRVAPVDLQTVGHRVFPSP
jgi:hypothetical protein